MKLTVYVQVADGAIQPVGHVEGDTEPEARSALAAVFRTMSALVDADAAWLETVLRYDEEGDR